MKDDQSVLSVLSDQDQEYNDRPPEVRSGWPDVAASENATAVLNPNNARAPASPASEAAKQQENIAYKQKKTCDIS